MPYQCNSALIRNGDTAGLLVIDSPRDGLWVWSVNR